MKSKIHPLSDVQTTKIGDDTFVWQFAVVLEGASIGANCNINCHTFIENNVSIGDNVTIKSGVFLWDGTTIEENVHIGPNVTFTNDKYPRSKVYSYPFLGIVIRKGASIGANSTILGGIEIGSYSLIGAGSVVTKSVPEYSLVVGNPARIVGWVDEKGTKLIPQGENIWLNSEGSKFRVQDDKLIRID